MSDFEQQINAILSNPQMMAQIQQLASSMQGSQDPSCEDTEPGNPPVEECPQDPPAADMLKIAMAFSGKTAMDKKQQALLSAMKPYLSKEKVQKLQSAMEAAHLAELATQLISGNFPGGISNV